MHGRVLFAAFVLLCLFFSIAAVHMVNKVEYIMLNCLRCDSALYGAVTDVLVRRNLSTTFDDFVSSVDDADDH